MVSHWTRLVWRLAAHRGILAPLAGMRELDFIGQLIGLLHFGFSSRRSFSPAASPASSPPPFGRNSLAPIRWFGFCTLAYSILRRLSSFGGSRGRRPIPARSRLSARSPQHHHRATMSMSAMSRTRPACKHYDHGRGGKSRAPG
jgi:hypothetical protein